MPAPRLADPTEPRFHRPLGRLNVEYPEFADGATTTNGTAIYAMITVAGLERFRVRLLTGSNGTLSVRFIRPAGIPNTLDFKTQADLASIYAANIYAQNQPADVAVVGATETKLDVTGHFGEGLAIVKFLPSSTSTLNYADFSGV